MIFLLCLLFFFSLASSQDLLSPTPETQKGIEFLQDIGFLQGKGNFVTRYEVAKALAALLERIKMTEQLLSESNPADKKEILSLVKQYAPELKALGSKVDEAVAKLKDIPDKKTFLQNEKTFFEQTIKESQSILDKGKEELKKIRSAQNQILISGSTSLNVSFTDHFQSGLDPGKEFLAATGCSPTSTDIKGRSPGSCFSMSHGLNLSFRATPPFLSSSSSKRVEISGKINFSSLSLGSPFSHPGSNRGNLSLFYKAPGSKFIELSGGETSSSAGFVGLPGLSMQGIKTSFSLGNITSLVFSGRVQKAYDSSGTPKYANTVRGTAFNLSYKGANQLKLSFFEDKLDGDSRVIDEANATSLTRLPDKISVFSAFTQFTYSKKLRIWGEWSRSRFEQWDSAFLIKDTIAEGADGDLITCSEGQTICRASPGSHADKDSTIFLALIYNDTPFSATNFFIQQNPKYHNRQGGAFGILSLFGGAGGTGALNLGGLDLGSLLTGGIRLLGTFTTCTAPSIKIFNPGSFVKRLLCNPLGIKNYSQSIVLATGTEVIPSKLSSLPQQFDVDLELDEDIDKRKHKLNILLAFPMTSWRVTPKTTVKFSILFVKADLPREIINGNNGAVERISMGQNSFCTNIALGFTDVDGLYSVKGGGERVLIAHFNPNDTAQEKVSFYDYDGGNCTLVDEQVVPVSKGDPVLIKDVTVDGKTTCVAGGPENLSFPCEGDYAVTSFSQDSSSGSLKVTSANLAKITPKPLELLVKVFQPKIEISHRFSGKLNYDFSWDMMNIILDKGVFYTADIKTVIEQAAIKFRKVTTVSHKLTYQLFRNLQAVASFSQTINKTYQSIDGHKERVDNFNFDLKLDF